MKTNKSKTGVPIKLMLLIAMINLFAYQNISAQICVTVNDNLIYGLTNLADIHPITVSTGVAGARLNGTYSGNVPSYSNAMGYNPVNGRLYYFKRNANAAPLEFVSFNPLTATVTGGAACPATSIINLGACTPNGLGYYCIDGNGKLYYYKVGTNSWTTICSNIRNTAGVSLATIINKGAPVGPTSRIYGDIAFDGSGNMWLLISGPGDYGVYKISGPIPTTAVTALTMNEILPPTTASPGGQTIGGIAFNSTGEMFFSTNEFDNKLYRLEKNYAVTYLSTMTVNSVGTDLTSCGYPMFVLSDMWEKFDVMLNSRNNIQLTWAVTEPADTKEYLVEYSSDGTRWEQIAVVPANGRNGSVNEYTYLHNSMVRGKHYYRIARADVYSKKAYSEIKAVYSNGNVSFSLFPNPSHDILQIEMSTAVNSSNAKVIVADQSGKMVMQDGLVNGINKFDIQKLTPGQYVVTLQFVNGEKVTQKFVKI